MKIAKRLTYILFILIAIPILLIGFITYNFAKKELVKKELSEINTIVDLNANILNNYHKELTDKLTIMQNSHHLKRSFDLVTTLINDNSNPNYQNLIIEISEKIKAYQYGNIVNTIFLINKNTDIIFSTNPTYTGQNLYNICSKKLLSPIKNNSNKIEFIHAHLDESNTSNIKLLIIAPFFNDWNNGGIVADINLNHFNNLINNNTRTGETVLGEIKENKIIFLNKLRFQNASVLKGSLNKDSPLAIPMQKALSKENSSGFAIDYRSKEVLAAWRYLPIIEWGLVSKIDKEEAYKTIYNLRNLFILIIIVSLFFSFWVAIAIADSISTPIKNLKSGVSMIDKGQLNVQIPIHDKDELGELSQDFNKMAKKLKESTVSIDQLKTEIQERVKIESALRTNEQKLDLALKSAQMGIWQVDLKENKRTFDSQTMHLLGLNPGTFKGSPEEFYNIIHPDDRDRIKAAMKRTVEKNVPYEPVYRVILPNGNVRYIDARGRLIKDSNDEPNKIIGIVFDITEQRNNETKILSSEQKFLIAFNAIPMPIAISEISDGRFIDVNKAFLDWSGSTHDELIGVSSLKLNIWVRPEDREAVKAILLKEGRADYFPTQIRRKGGDIRDVFFFARIIELENKKYLLSICQDITEQKLTDEKLKIINEQLSFAQQASGTGMWDWDIKTGRLDWSPELLDLFGLKESISSPSFDLWRNILHPDDRLIAEENINDAIRNHKPLINEYRIILPSGEIRWINALGNTLFDENGKAKRMSGVCIDITARKQAEKEIKEKTEEIKRYFDTSLDLLCIADTNGNFIRLNPEWKNTLGYELNELEGKKFIDYVHPDDIEATLEAVSRLSKQNPVLNFTNRYRHKDGSYRSIEWRSFPSGKMIYASARDITNRILAEKEIKDSENRYRDLVASVTDYIYTVKLENGRVVSTTHGRGCISVTGYTTDDFLKDDYLWYKMVHDEDKPLVQKFTQTILSGYKVPPFEHRIIHKDGSLRWVRDTVVLHFDNRGRLISYDGLVTDITARKLAEEELKKEKEKAQKYLDIADVMIIAIDIEQKVILANKKASQVFGYEEKEILGKNWFDLVIPEAIRNDTKSVFNDLMNGKIEPWGYHENIVLTKTGEEKLIAWHNTTIRDENSNIMATLSSGEDITQRKQEEAALKEAEELFRSLFEKATDGMLLVDMQTKIFLRANIAISQMLGWSQEEFTSLSIPDIHIKEDLPIILEAFNRLLSGEIKTAENIPVKRKDGTIMFFDISSSNITIAGKTCVLGIFRDITERKKAEEEKERLQDQLLQAQKLKSIGTMANGFAHNFNNILAAINGYVEMALAQAEKNNKLKKDLENAVKGITSAKQLIQQMLIFSRSEKTIIRPIEISPAIIEALSLFKASIKGPVNIINKIDSDCGKVSADPTQLQQILINLCNNSFHALNHPNDPIEVSLTKVNIDSNTLQTNINLNIGNYVKLAVKDSGKGIDKEAADRLFEPFFTTKEVGKGTGLGLSIVYGLVKEYNGAINVESKLNEGTTITIFLPQVES